MAIWQNCPSSKDLLNWYRETDRTRFDPLPLILFRKKQSMQFFISSSFNNLKPYLNTALRHRFFQLRHPVSVPTSITATSLSFVIPHDVIPSGRSAEPLATSGGWSEGLWRCHRVANTVSARKRIILSCTIVAVKQSHLISRYLISRTRGKTHQIICTVRARSRRHFRGKSSKTALVFLKITRIFLAAQRGNPPYISNFEKMEQGILMKNLGMDSLRI